MFLFFLAQIPLTAMWFARPILRNCNLQTLVVAPTVFLLLLVPQFFPSKAEPTTANNAMPESTIDYMSAGYTPSDASSFSH